ncbi:MAG: HvfC/BufC N-terminal domain-containing protein [Immundisolibacter sp.]|uniref:HvfC/BufC N-terminal domain-containing protein n=1 Tax=Immundisolibacter sp. TaxID=1934948 RepID=UPI003EE07343
MPSLAELQTAFAGAVLDHAAGIETFVSGNGLDPAQRVQVYRNAVRIRLKEALADVYPVLRHLVGDDCFDAVASAFLSRHPPRVGHLHPFGAQMPELCSQLPVLAALPYLPDVARLEWAWQQAYHGADAPRVSIEDFAGVPAEQHANIRLQLHPSAQLLRSAFPVGRIFEVNQADYRGDDRVNLDLGGESLLVIRRGLQVRVESLSAGEYALLTQLDADMDLGGALASALTAEPGLDAGTALAGQVTSGTFSTLTITSG